MTDDGQDDFLRRQDEERMLAAVQAKAETGERLSHREHVMLAADECARLNVKIRREMRQVRFADGKDHVVRYTQGAHDAVNAAISMLISAMAAGEIAQTEARERLEDRIAALEGSKPEAVQIEVAKPAIRVVR